VNNTQKTLKDLLSFSDEQLLALCNENQEAADTLTNVYSCLEPILGRLSFDRLFQKKFAAKGEDANRFVSFCICDGKKRLTAEFVKTKGKMKNGETFYKNLCLTGLKETGAALAKWNEKLSQVTGEPASTNLGILPGWIDKEKSLYLGFFDLDNKGVIQGKIQKVIEILDLKTFISATPSGGRHLYVLSHEPLTNVPFFKNIDVRGNTYVLAPGSRTEKGVYTVDLENPFFSTEIAVLPENWRELYKSRLEAEFSQEEEEDSSIAETLEAKGFCVALDSRQRVISSKPILNQKKMTGVLGLVWKEGERNSSLVQYAGGKIHDFIGTNDFQGFVDHLKQVSVDRIENPSTFHTSEVVKVAKTLWNKEKLNPTTNRKKRERDSSIAETLDKCQRVDLSKSWTQKLVKSLSMVEKTDSHEVKIESIVAAVQSFYETLFGKKYKKDLPSKVVGAILTNAGFSKKERRLNGERTRFWNVSLNQVLSIVQALSQEAAALHTPTKEQENEQSPAPQREEAEKHQAEELRNLSRGRTLPRCTDQTTSSGGRPQRDPGALEGWWSDRVSTEQLAEHLPNAA